MTGSGPGSAHWLAGRAPGRLVKAVADDVVASCRNVLLTQSLQCAACQGAYVDNSIRGQAQAAAHAATCSPQPISIACNPY